MGKTIGENFFFISSSASQVMHFIHGYLLDSQIFDLKVQYSYRLFIIIQLINPDQLIATDS